MGFDIFWFPTKYRAVRFSLSEQKFIMNEFNKREGGVGTHQNLMLIAPNLNFERGQRLYPKNMAFWNVQVKTYDKKDRTYSNRQIQANIRRAGKIFKQVIRDGGGNSEDFRGESDFNR